MADNRDRRQAADDRGERQLSALPDNRLCYFDRVGADNPDLTACAVALTALYLRGGPHRTRLERMRWLALSAALRRRAATLGQLADCAREEGFPDEALVLDSAQALDWAERRVHSGEVVTAVSADYPSRWLQVLGASAPPALWSVRHGRVASAGGHGTIAVVGSREISASIRRLARSVGQVAASAGLELFSGNAKGCDEASMRGAVSVGGRVVGVLPHGIRRLERRISGVQYLSVCPPDEEFSRGSAMERNALIYAAAEASVVVHARLREGGTWFGAVEAHRRKLTRLIVWQDASLAGNRGLLALGATPLSLPEELTLAIANAGRGYALFD